MVGGGRPLYLKFWVRLAHPASKRLKMVIFNRYSLVAAQTLHLAEKVQLCVMGSRLQAFQ